MTGSWRVRGAENCSVLDAKSGTDKPCRSDFSDGDSSAALRGDAEELTRGCVKMPTRREVE